MVKRPTSLLLAAIALLAGALAPAAAAAPPACTITWTGGSSPKDLNWSTPSNWDQNRLPGASGHSNDVVCLNTVQATGDEPVVDTAFSVDSVQATVPIAIKAALSLTSTTNTSTFDTVDLSAGALDSAGTATVAGNLNWTGGDLGGSGGTTHVLSSGTLAVNIASYVTVNVQTGHALITDGTGSCACGSIGLAAGATWTNHGSFDLSGAASSANAITDVSNGSTPAPVFDNAAGGQLTKNAGSTSVTLRVPVQNDGEITASAGTLILDGGGSGTSTGSFVGQSGGIVEFSYLSFGTSVTFALGAGASLDGVLVLGFEGEFGGDLEVAAGATASAGTLTLDGGILGGAGELDVSGALHWKNNGALTGSGTTRILSNATADFADDPSYSTTQIQSGHTLRNDGTIQWTSGTLRLGAGATFANTASGTVHQSGGGSRLQDWASTAPQPQLLNSGKYVIDPTASSSPPSYMSIDVTNSGAITAPAGPSFDGGPQLILGGSSWTLSDSGTIAGAQLDSPATAGTGAQLTADALAATLTLPSGVTATATNSTLGGDLHGSGTLMDTGTLTWSAGTAFDQVLVDVPAGSTLVVDQPALFGGSVLETDGTTTFTGSFGGRIQLRESAMWLNTGTVTLSSGTQLLSDPGYGGTILQLFNTGTINGPPSGSATLDGVFNDGTINLPRGQLTINKLDETSDATINVGIGGTNAGSDYGQLTASGGLAGTLHVALDPGYTPPVGATYDVVLGPGAQTADPFTITGLPSTLSAAWSSNQYSSKLELTGVAAAARATSPSATSVTSPSAASAPVRSSQTNLAPISAPATPAISSSALPSVRKRARCRAAPRACRHHRAAARLHRRARPAAHRRRPGRAH